VAIAEQRGGSSSDGGATLVQARDLGQHPSSYIDKRIKVDGEVQKVIGPRLFTINGSTSTMAIMVVLPAPVAAMVNEHDPVTVEGMVEPLSTAHRSPLWGWLRLDSATRAKRASSPVLFADRLFGGADRRPIALDASATSGGVTSNDSAAAHPQITAVDTLVEGTDRLAGETVHLSNVMVDGLAPNSGFFVAHGSDRVLVSPALAPPSTLAAGDTVSIDGVVAPMAADISKRMNGRANSKIYVYALGVRQ
jgi:hypothetical protein